MHLKKSSLSVEGSNFLQEGGDSFCTNILLVFVFFNFFTIRIMGPGWIMQKGILDFSKQI